MKRKLLFLLTALLLLTTGNAWGAEMTTMTGLLGLADNSGGFADYQSKHVTLAAGESYQYTFINYNKGAGGTDYWENWVVEANNGSKYLDFRADGGFWGELPTAANYSGSVWDNVSSTKTVWLEAYNGVTVTVTVSRSNDGTTFTVAHTATLNTSATYAGTYTATISAEDNITFYLMNEDSHQIINRVIDSNASGGTIYALPKMTYVNYSDADASYGEIAYGETAEAGYNNLSGTYPDQTVGFAQTGWGVNYITYINADASDVPDGATMTTATLAFNQSGSTDSKRTTGVGAGYNSSTWSNSMTYNTADKSITTIGDVVWTSTKSASIFESKSINILAAFSGDADNIVNVILYETAAAGCYIKNPELTVSYTTASAYNVTFTETNSVAATIKIGDTDVTAGTSLVDGNYSFTATAAGYEEYNGNFTVSGADKNVEFTMTAKTPVTSITVNYTYNDGIVFSEAQSAIAGLYVGDSYEVPFRMYVMNGSTLYKSTKRGSNPWYGEPTTLTANTVIEKAVTPVDLGGGVVAFFEDLDNTTGQNAGIRASYCSAYDNRAYTSAENLPAGTYNFIVFGQNKNRGSSVKIGETTVFTIDGSKDSWLEYTISNVAVPAAGKLALVPGGGSTYDDYDIIIAVLKSVPVTIGGEGYSTFGCQYPLDLENLPSGLEAFKATGVNGSNYVVFQGLNTAVAANTGILLKGTADTEYDIPVAASGETVTGNLLFVNEDGDTFTPESGYNYFGLVKDSKKFALFAPGTVAIPANKAYLKIAETSARTVLYIDEDDAPTAINAIEAADTKAEGLKDGKYFIGNKIVLVKNGVKFNANGQILK